jgi:hypothetical protein
LWSAAVLAKVGPLEERAVGKIAVGSFVAVIERPELEGFLRSADARAQPAPAQFAGAGRHARVVGVRLDGAEPLYALRDLPGLWREAWLRPL